MNFVIASNNEKNVLVEIATEYDSANYLLIINKVLEQYV